MSSAAVYNMFKGGSYALHVVFAWKGHYSRTENCARLARIGIKPINTRLQLVLHTSGKVSIAFGLQYVTECVNGKIHRGTTSDSIRQRWKYLMILRYDRRHRSDYDLFVELYFHA